MLGHIKRVTADPFELGIDRLDRLEQCGNSPVALFKNNPRGSVLFQSGSETVSVLVVRFAFDDLWRCRESQTANSH